jgi:hypothetical protein
LKRAEDGLITIKMDELKDLAQNLASFLKERLGLEASVQDDKLMVKKKMIVSKGRKREMTARRLKVYLKRFLYLQGLRKKYRVLVKGSEMNVVKLKEEVKVS